jgi:hypothetical protein
MQPNEVESRYLNRLKAAGVLGRFPALAREYERREAERQHGEACASELEASGEALLIAERAKLPATVVLSPVPCSPADIAFMTSQPDAVLTTVHVGGHTTRFALRGGIGFADAEQAATIRAALADAPRYEQEAVASAPAPFSDLQLLVSRAVGAHNTPRLDSIWSSIVESLHFDALSLAISWFDAEPDGTRKAKLRSALVRRHGFDVADSSERAQLLGAAA